MNWKQYTEKALSTSIHNTREKKITCCLFGLLGESNEYIEKIKSDGIDKDEIKKELGDIFWYLAVLCSELDIIEPEYLVHRYVHFSYLYKYNSKLQELMKKNYRDFNYSFNTVYQNAIKEYIDLIYTTLLREIEYYNWKLSDILQINIDKLQSRKERNVLKGEGDNR